MGGKSPTMIDESFSTAAPSAVKAAGVDVVMMYLSPDASKNATVSKVRGYHRVGVGVLLGWESYASRALAGRAAGHADAVEAVRQYRELEHGCGYAPANVPAIVFAVDFAATPGQHGAIKDYFRGVREVLDREGFRSGVYGNADVVAMLHAAGLTETEWQTYAWSGGRLSPDADAYQWLNGQRMGGASVDFGSVLHADELGVWWAPGDKRNTGDNMTISDRDVERIAERAAAKVWAHSVGGADKGDSTRRVDVAAVTAMNRLYGVQADLDHLRGEVRAIHGKVNTVAQILGAAKSGVADRVAGLGVELGKVAAAVAAIKPTTQVQVDTAQIVDGVTAKLSPASIAAAVEAKVKAITWKAGA